MRSKIIIPYNNLAIHDPNELNQYLEVTSRVLTRGKLILGEEVEELEALLASRCKRRYAIAVGSGTDALILAIKALGIKEGDEVITNAFSWIATVNAIRIAGATPVLADTTSDLLICPNSVERMVTKKTRAILAVNYGGLCCDYDRLHQLTQNTAISIIEDASQSLGAARKYRPSGSFGEISCASLNPMKLIGAFGEAGVCLTDNPDLKESLVALRYNGMKDREISIATSINARIDTLQAAYLNTMIRNKIITRKLNKRRSMAEYYKKAFRNLNMATIDLDNEMGTSNIFFTFFIKTNHADLLHEYLKENEVETKKRTHDFLPLQPSCRDVKHDTNTIEQIYPNLLALPLHDKLTMNEQDFIIEKIRLRKKEIGF